MRRTFRDQTVVITGGAGGIGRALGRRFRAAGARVALLDVDEAGLAEAQKELGEVLALRCDVTDLDDCRRAIDRVVEELDGVDALVNNAGLVHRSAFADTDVSVLRRVMEVNFFGAVNCTKAALPSLRERRGIIVVTSSVAGLAPLLGRTGYAASKHALHGLFESLRGELAPDGVAVTLVCPGFTESPFESNALGARGERIARPRSKVGRQASTAEVAEGFFRAASSERPLVVLSAVGRLTRALTRLWPEAYERLMVRALRGELEGESTGG